MDDINDIDNMVRKYEDLQKRLIVVEQQIKALAIIHEQLLDDLEMAEWILMYQTNRQDRIKEMRE